MSAIDTPTPPAPQNGGGAHISPIADLTYRNYDGPLKSRAVRWWIVALATIRANVNRTRYGYWIPAGIVTLIYLGHGIFFYVTQGVRQQIEAMGSMMPGAPTPVNPYAVELFTVMSLGFVSLMVFIAALVVGSASIAADNRANALLVYLSKPLNRWDYLLGKWMGIFLLLAGLVLAPSLLMFLFFVGAYASDGFLKDNPTLIFRVLLAGIIPAALHSSLIIGFSAWSKSARVAGAVYAAFYLVLSILTLIIGGVLWWSDKSGAHSARSAVVLHSSVDGVRNGLGEYIYDVDPAQVAAQQDQSGKRRNRRARLRRRLDLPERLPERPPLWTMLLIGGGMIVLPVAAAAYKVRAVEVVTG